MVQVVAHELYLHLAIYKCHHSILSYKHKPTSARPHLAHSISRASHLYSSGPPQLFQPPSSPYCVTPIDTIHISPLLAPSVHSLQLSLALPLVCTTHTWSFAYVISFFSLQISLCCLPPVFISNPSSRLVSPGSHTCSEAHPLTTLSHCAPLPSPHHSLRCRLIHFAHGLCPQSDGKLNEIGSCLEQEWPPQLETYGHHC